MSNIFLNQEEINFRPRKLPQILKECVPHGTNTLGTHKKTTSNSLEIGVHSGTRSGNDVRSLRFATIVDNYKGSYFEIWNRKGSLWYLSQAYLTIFHVTNHGIDEEEVIALHCDPLEDLKAAHYKYKTGPHLHFKRLGNPLSHSHVALNLSHLDDTMSSFDKLSLAMKNAIDMIKNQILDYLNTV